MGRTDLRPDITKEVLEEYIRKGYSQNRIAIMGRRHTAGNQRRAERRTKTRMGTLVLFF